jgi:ABC-type transporter MlaC component
MVRDIVTEGSSLVNSYRAQFRRIIEKKGKKKGVDELFQLMEKKLEKKRAKEKQSGGTSKTCSPPAKK